jgi:mono/diheme cytochrome c family protein
MRILLALSGLVLALAAAGAVFVASGIYDFAATRQHTAPVYWLIDTTLRRSVRNHARDVVPPPLDDPALAARGRALYAAHCVQCHGAPGVAPEPFALGLMPQPANLAQLVRERSPSELFWVAKYGIKTTGMPAWEYRLTDDDLWAIVAFLPVLGRESPQAHRSAAGALPRVAPAGDPAATEVDPERGRAALQQYACTTCHTIPGVVGANAHVGPPLARAGARAFIAGTIPNTEDNMVRWLRDPQAIHRNSAMPRLGVTERDARDMAAFLRSLR